MNVLELLEAGRAIIADPAHWAQDTFAYDADGKEVWSTSPTAVCWCSVGVLHKVVSDVQTPSPLDGDLRCEAEHMLSRASRKDGANQSIAWFNDSHTHAEVLAVWDIAITEARKLESEGQPIPMGWTP